MNREDARVRRLLSLFGSPSGDGLELGIGDDAAILRPPEGRVLVFTVDAQVEGVHFRRGWLSWADCGYRSFVAAASDVSAMGASPWCALSALSLSADVGDAELSELASGQRAASLDVGARVVGGNLSGGPVVTITTTVLGHALRPVARSGARPGDGLWMAGEAGLAAAGLRALAAGVGGSAVGPAIDAWRRPKPRVAEGLALGERAHAAIDVSDGVALDASRMAESSGVCVVLDAAALLAACGDALGRAASVLSADPLTFALEGGEDYALLAASDGPLPGFVRIGEIRPGRGVVLRNASGERVLGDPGGFDHFA